MALRVAVYGCGRVGLIVAKILLQRSDVILVGLIGSDQADVVAGRLQHDLVYGDFQAHIAGEANTITVDAEVIPYAKNLKNFNSLDTGIEVLIDTTEEIYSHRQAEQVLNESGAKKLLIAGDVDDLAIPRIIAGVNEQQRENAMIVSNGSASSQAIALIEAILKESFDITTSTTTLLHDGVLRNYKVLADVRSSRDQFDTIIPLKAQQDRMTVFSVPVSSVSLVEVVALSKDHITDEMLQASLAQTTTEPYFQGLVSISDEQLVSTNFRGNPHSVVIDKTLSRVIDGKLVKVIGWFDAEWAYGNRLAEIAVDLGKHKEKKS